MKKRLLKDIVIKAGTIFNDAPIKTLRAPGCVMSTFGLSDNTFGTIEYRPDDDEDEMKEWFEDVE